MTDRKTAKQKREIQNVIYMHLDIKKQQINKIILNYSNFFKYDNSIFVQVTDELSWSS